MRVARHDNPAILRSQLYQGDLHVMQGRDAFRECFLHPQLEVGDNLIVARPRRVQATRGRPTIWVSRASMFM